MIFGGGGGGRTRFPGQGGPDAVHNRVVAQSEPAKRLANAIRTQPRFYPQELPATPQEVARARAINKANPNTTFFTPSAQRAANKMYARNASPLDKIGNHMENFLQLKQMGQQLTQMFNPTTKTGLANIAGMFAGGGEGGLGDATPALDGAMPNQFEPYSMTKASMSDQIGRQLEHQPRQTNYAIRYANKLGAPMDAKATAIANRTRLAQLVHDHMFGGEVHARGPIPPRPTMRASFRKYR